MFEGITTVAAIVVLFLLSAAVVEGWYASTRWRRRVRDAWSRRRNRHDARQRHVDDVDFNSERGIWASAVNRATIAVGQFGCGLRHGHNEVLHYPSAGRVCLLCTSCGRQTPGWDLRTGAAL